MWVFIGFISHIRLLWYFREHNECSKAVILTSIPLEFRFEISIENVIWKGLQYFDHLFKNKLGLKLLEKVKPVRILLSDPLSHSREMVIKLKQTPSSLKWNNNSTWKFINFFFLGAICFFSSSSSPPPPKKKILLCTFFFSEAEYAATSCYWRVNLVPLFHWEKLEKPI